MTFPANNPGTALIGDYTDVAALHAATKASVDAVTTKLEAMRLLIDTLEALGAAGNALLGTINTAVQDNTPAAVTVAQLPATVGPKTAALSVSMAFATDATQPLPTGAATETTLGAVNTKLAGPLTTRQDGVADAAKTPGWDGSALPTDGYGAAVLTISAIAGGASITVTGTGAGTSDHSLAIINLATNTIVSAITAVGVYQVTAAGSLKYAKAGGTGTATVNVLLKR